MLLFRMVLMLFFMYQSVMAHSQIHYYSDNVQGGFVGDGYTAWYTGGASIVQLPIPVGSTVKKAFLFSNLYKWQGNNIPANNKSIELNGQSIILSEEYSIGNQFYSQFNQMYISTIAVDITEQINPAISNYTINPFTNTSPVESPLFTDFYILVVYENPTFETSCLDIWINDFNVTSTVTYNLSASNSINNISDVGLSVYASSICDFHDDWWEVFINSNSIGEIGGQESNTNVYCAGVVGSFSYNNSTLIGNGNDIGNNTMDSVDVIANIQSYINGLSNFSVVFDTIGNSGVKSNNINQLYLTYKTNCDTFSVSTPNDTTICQGTTLQLNATGGQTYEWLLATGLSCNTCPNPIFTADSSMFYTVRIWNNDSCSVVRPLKINVRAKPTFGSITTTPSECGAPTGSAAAGSVSLNALPNNGSVATWQEVGSVTQSSNVFSGLSPGNHTFNFIDTNGCQSADTLVFVNEINSTIASFVADPLSGAKPLTVNFTNTSQNASSFEWFVSTGSTTSSEGSNLQFFEFPSSGTYQIMLVAWQFNPSCADTAYQTILVYDSLTILVPNVFTPNNDGINDYFSLTANQDVDYELIIVNRWGETVFEEKSQLLANTTKNCWNGTSTGSSTVTDGVYFVQFKVIPEKGDVIEVSDFVTVKGN